jgi:hypothetical protein
VVPTWFILGSDWQVQGTGRQKQQQQQQQMKAQANKKDGAAAPRAGKLAGSAVGQAKQQQAKQQHKGEQQQQPAEHVQPDAYAREQHSHVSSKPNAAADGKKRRDRSAEAEAETHKQPHQQQVQRYQNQEKDEEWPQDSVYAGLFGQQGSGIMSDTQRWLARLAGQQDMVQADAEHSSHNEDLSIPGFRKQDTAGYMGYKGHVRAQPEGRWRWYADDADEGEVDSAVQLQGLSWGEDEPDWDDDGEDDD